MSDIKEIKQFYFQEEIWKIIKEYFISNRSKWLYAMRDTGINSLRTFLEGISSYSDHYSKKLIKEEKTEDFETVKKIKNQIITYIQRRPDCQRLFKDGIQIYSGVESLESLKLRENLKLGEDILFFFSDTKEDIESFSGYRKAIIRKINKDAILIELYNYELKITYPRYVDKMIWLDTFEKKIIIKYDTMSSKIRQRGIIYPQKYDIPKIYDNEFELGKRAWNGFK